MSAPYRREIKDWRFFTAQAANATSTAVLDVADFRDVVLSIATAGSGNLVVRVKGALGRKGVDATPGAGEYLPPLFGSSASATNDWAYIETVDLNTAVPYVGSSGVIFTGTDGVILVEVNTNALDFITVEVSSYVAGNVGVRAASVTNL